MRAGMPTDTEKSSPLVTRTRWRIAALATAASLLGACAQQPPQASKDHTAAVHVERVDSEFPLDKSIARVEIVNRYGEINVRGRDDAEVGVHAVIQQLPPDFANGRLRSRRENGTLHIEAEFPAASGETPGRMDIAVYLPPTVAIALQTRDGRIAARRRSGAIEASSESGAIEASSTARLDLRSDSGEIRAAAIGRRWSGASHIESVSGRIIVLVPTFGDVSLDVETRGRLSTNFGLSVHQQGDMHSAHARYGMGTSPLVVRSRSGEVVLDQLVLMGDDTLLPEDDD